MSYLNKILKRFSFGLLLLSALSGSVFAENNQTISVEAGFSGEMFGSGGFGQKLALVSYRYNKDWYYLGAESGGWIGSRGVYVTGWQVGVQYRGLSLGTGLAGISHQTPYLGTSWQILSTLRYTFEPVPVFIAWNHISNGSKIFGSPLPNIGENFFTIGYSFKF